VNRQLEICIETVASARAATRGGADRVELCANLPEGGTTPSLGMLRAVRKVVPGGLMVLIRPRGSDFDYNEDELEVMCDDIRTAREAGADGVVIGCLAPDGSIERDQTARLMEEADGLDFTFHRAFDMSRDLAESLETIAALGIRRILTSGGAPDALAGAATIKALVEQAAGRVSLMPGGGLTPANIAALVQATGVHEVHLSARSPVASRMAFRNFDCSMGEFSNGREYQRKQSDPALVRAARSALDGQAD
jgi:copper homeostasis protein